MNKTQIKSLFCKIWDKVSRRIIWLYLDLSIHGRGQEFMVLGDNHRLLTNKYYFVEECGGPSLEVDAFWFNFSISKVSIREIFTRKLWVNTSTWLYEESCSIFLHKGNQLNNMDNSRKQSIEIVSADILYNFGETLCVNANYFLRLMKITFLEKSAKVKKRSYP